MKLTLRSVEVIVSNIVVLREILYDFLSLYFYNSYISGVFTTIYWLKIAISRMLAF